MPTLTKQQAVDRLNQAVPVAQADDLVEIHNELFPQEPATYDQAVKDPSGMAEKIRAHIDNGLEVEEILDLWPVVFPAHHRVWFDEEDDLIHYDENSEPVGQAE